MMLHKTFFAALLLALFPILSAGSAERLDLAAFFESAAGRVVAREMGLPNLRFLDGPSFSRANAERLIRHVEEVRARYLHERPRDEAIFRPVREGGVATLNRSRQE